jgi:nitrate/nitrite sensing protein/histidine kinase/DNA gyrase B/HSP90-like ATPase
MMRRRSIRLRIVVLVLVPALALLGLFAEVLGLTLSHLLTLRQEAAIRQLVVPRVTNVQTQLSEERTQALDYLARPSSGALGQLEAQEKRTDASIERFRAAVQTALRSGPVSKERQAFVSWQGHLARIGGLRTSVHTLGITTISAVSAYSTMLNDGDNVINQANLAVLTGRLSSQATGVLTMARSAQNMGQESDLLRADLLARSFPSASLILISELSVLHQQQRSQTLSSLNPTLRNNFRSLVPAKAAGQLQEMESQVANGASAAAKVPLRTWTAAENAYQRGFLNALLKSQATLSKEAANQVQAVILRLALIAGVGLVAILTAVTVGIAIARGLVRQLTDLHETAVKLSTEQLPGTISRLRAGEDVDVGAEVPQLKASGDEIGQVKQAFNVAARTALVAAADEVKIRRGVNDVFRSLARRNQSLLTRQLQLLDSMERRVHDPEELADLFRVDHMTTRMRRHAEGLLIVAGGSSGRAWREPVPIVDVMRAAAAEVEDYPRIRVTSRTGAALAGHAVADIIHMLAELIENAATFSPASTPVRVDGERVARGVAVEIEDRGLGMGEVQLAELNATLADPPLFDMSGSDQLGLFIAGQLARRHDVRLTLRGSAYGGITAVVLIPAELIVDTGEPEEPLPIAGIRELGGRPVPELPGAIPDPGQAISPVVSGTEYLTGLDTLTGRPVGRGADRAAAMPDGVAEPVYEAVSEPAASAEAWQVSGYLAGDPTTPELPRREPGTTGLRRLNQRENAGTAWATNPLFPGESAHETTQETRVQPASSASHAAFAGAAQAVGPPAEAAVPGADRFEVDGLPVRVRQANLAPQLRQQAIPPPRETGEPPAYPPAGPSPEAARSTMAALQLGWQRGRSVAEPAADELPAGPGPRQAGGQADEGGSP